MIPVPRLLERTTLVLLTLATVGGVPLPAQAPDDFALGTAFRYLGHLQHRGAPAEGRFDLTYEAYDAREGGRLLGRIDRLDREIRGGVLEADLDFGLDVFADGPPWLEIHVRPAGTGPYTPLLPRQLVTRGATCTVNQDVDVNGDLTVGDGHQLTVGGPLTGLRMAEREISVSPLWLDPQLLINPGGGDAQVGIGVAAAEAPLSLPAGPDASPAGGGALVVGPTSGSNLALDANEIMARNNGAAATLFLNPEGGNVQVGGPLFVGYEVVTQGGCGLAGVITAVCPAGKRVLGGGCYWGEVYDSFPSCADGYSCPGGNRAYTCNFTTGSCDGVARAYAICATIR